MYVHYVQYCSPGIVASDDGPDLIIGIYIYFYSLV